MADRVWVPGFRSPHTVCVGRPGIHAPLFAMCKGCCPSFCSWDSACDLRKEQPAASHSQRHLQPALQTDLLLLAQSHVLQTHQLQLSQQQCGGVGMISRHSVGNPAWPPPQRTALSPRAKRASANLQHPPANLGCHLSVLSELVEHLVQGEHVDLAVLTGEHRLLSLVLRCKTRTPSSNSAWTDA